MTAIMGLIPLAIEKSPFYSPLAWVLIGGLSTSTILTLLVISAIYKLMPPDIKPIDTENSGNAESSGLQLQPHN
ncbi:MAG: hypothetical protein V4577_26460 [Bacteroidota bacterium]